MVILVSFLGLLLIDVLVLTLSPAFALMLILFFDLGPDYFPRPDGVFRPDAGLRP